MVCLCDCWSLIMRYRILLVVPAALPTDQGSGADRLGSEMTKTTVSMYGGSYLHMGRPLEAVDIIHIHLSFLGKNRPRYLVIAF